MTTLISWVAIDERSASAVYMAADSRLSWGDYGTWDSGRKIFASERFPEILGYTGEAFFCTQVLSQIISFIDTCAPIAEFQDFSSKSEYVEGLIKRAFQSYPTRFCLPNFSILYLTRMDNLWGACTFSWTSAGGWGRQQDHSIPMSWSEVRAGDSFPAAQARAVMFVSAGSGGEEFRNYYNDSEWFSKLPLLSRGIFGAFADFVRSDKKADHRTAGKPQLCGLYRKKEAQKIGFVEGDSRYLYGIELAPGDYQPNVRWVNSTFENCAALSGARIPGEQRQPAPYARTTW